MQFASADALELDTQVYSREVEPAPGTVPCACMIRRISDRACSGAFTPPRGPAHIFSIDFLWLSPLGSPPYVRGNLLKEIRDWKDDGEAARPSQSNGTRPRRLCQSAAYARE